MLVNNYFIETLVLCFSCGCDQDNLNYDNIADLSNSTKQCSINAPARMILGKKIKWSGEDQCTVNGPIKYDLEPIKVIVELLLKNNPTPECIPTSTAAPESVTSKTPGPPCPPNDPNCLPTEWPSCPPNDPNCLSTKWPPCPPNDPNCRPNQWPPCPPNDPYCRSPQWPPCPPNDPNCASTQWPPCSPNDPNCPSTQWPAPWIPGPAPWIPVPPCSPYDPNCLPTPMPPCSPYDPNCLPTTMPPCPPNNPNCWSTQAGPDKSFTTEPPWKTSSTNGLSTCGPPICPLPPAPCTPAQCPPPQPAPCPPSICPPRGPSSPGITLPPGTQIPELPPQVLPEILTTGGNNVQIMIQDENYPSPAEILNGISQNETGHAVILIVNGESDGSSWQARMQANLSASWFMIPTTIIVVDWSAYVSSDYRTTAAYGTVVARNLAKWINGTNIKNHQVTIIGVGTNAHVAGIVGKTMQQSYGSTIFKIIALDPTGMIFNEAAGSQKLGPSDAIQVLVIHTETSKIGYCCYIGTVDVIVNNPLVAQPWCTGPRSDECSHYSVVEIFMSAIINGPMLARKKETNEPLFGFPLHVSVEISGVYYIETIEVTHPPTIPPEQWPPEKFPPKTIWPKPPQLPEKVYNATDIIIVGKSTGESHDTIFTSQESGSEIKAWISENPNSKIIVIITQESSQDWAVRLREELLNQPDNKYVIILDWSMYVYPSKLFTAWYSKQVAETFYNWMMLQNIPAALVTIIGYSTSAHVAGIIGNYYKKGGNSIDSIHGLDPEGLMWCCELNMLSSSSATMVQVIHTNTQNYGILEVLGAYNIYINGGASQPHCQIVPDVLDECSHRSVISYYIESISVVTYANEAILENKIAVDVSGGNKVRFGYHLRTKSTYAGVFNLQTHGSSLIPENQQPPDTAPPNFPPPNSNATTDNYDPNKIQIVGMETTGSYEAQYPVQETTNVFTTWVKENPTSEIFLIITEEKYSDWAADLRKALLKLPDPKYVLIADWSMYVYPSHQRTAAVSILVANTISDWMGRVMLDVSRLEIIGFSTSCHVAGMIGHTMREYGNIVQRITALDPASDGWSYTHKLSSSSAQIVQVIHTNTMKYGYLGQLGLYDIYVNGGRQQLACINDGRQIDECSHHMAIKYYTESISVYALATEAQLINGDAVISGHQKIGFGYWLMPDYRVTVNTFNLVTDPNMGSILPAPSEVDQPDPSDINQWPPFMPASEWNLCTNLVFRINYIEDGKEINRVAQFPGRMPNINALETMFQLVSVSTHPIMIIINGERDNDFKWAIQLKDTLLVLHPDISVIMVDWSAYKSNSYITTASYVYPIGLTIAQSLSTARAPANRIHIVGYSMGAHIASFVGKELQTTYSVKLDRITGLDPARFMFYHPSVLEGSRLTLTDANFVDVIHTNTLYFGFPSPLGHVDTYVNGGSVQPGCFDHECGHQRSIYYFIESIRTRAQSIRASYQHESILPLKESHFATFGYYADLNILGVFNLKTNDNRPFLKTYGVFIEVHNDTLDSSGKHNHEIIKLPI